MAAATIFARLSRTTIGELNIIEQNMMLVNSSHSRLRISLEPLIVTVLLSVKKIAAVPLARLSTTSTTEAKRSFVENAVTC